MEEKDLTHYMAPSADHRVGTVWPREARRQPGPAPHTTCAGPACMKGAFRYLVASQVVFFGLLVICVYLAPQSVTNNRGLSYFGYSWPALIPFTGALLGGAYCLLQAATRLSVLPWPLPAVGRVLRVVALLTPFVLLTPSNDPGLIHDAHVTISSAVFIMEFALSTALLASPAGNWPDATAGLVQLVAGLAALLSFFGILRIMLPSELILQLTFSFVLDRTVPKIGRAVSLSPGLGFSGTRWYRSTK